MINRTAICVIIGFGLGLQAQSLPKGTKTVPQSHQDAYMRDNAKVLKDIDVLRKDCGTGIWATVDGATKHPKGVCLAPPPAPKKSK